jgi:FtsH-binding integral membrane protein
VWFSAAMIVLACGYILYDTSNVLHHYRTDQYVAAAVALFASVALLFWYVLRIMMAFSRR